MTRSELARAARLLTAAQGARCWYVSVGAPTLPTFHLVMGDQIPRERPLRRTDAPEAFRKYTGSVELLVWSAWRLQCEEEVIGGSRQAGDAIVSAVSRLRGETLQDVACVAPAWDINVVFTGGFRLSVFCDAVAPAEAFEQNWDFRVPGYLISAGPGCELLVKPK